MADSHLRSFIRRLRQIVGQQEGVRAWSDGQLIEAFLDRQDEAAMEMLVWRHGIMILNLCRRILHDEDRAEDAFQATFLVFVRKASSIGKRQSVSSWLYKVALRVAFRLRDNLAKQPEQTSEADCFPEREPVDDLNWRDLRSVLDQEIDRLPEKYRSPIQLCYLQGYTHEQAAELLGCSKAAIVSRLWRGREQLRSRLTRRGVTLSAGGLVTHLSVNGSSAALPAQLVDSTVKAAVAFAARKTAIELVSSSVAALTQGVLHTMFITKLKIAVTVVFIAATALLCTCLVVGGTDRKKRASFDREDGANGSSIGRARGAARTPDGLDAC